MTRLSEGAVASPTTLLRVRQDNGVLVVELDRPGKYNALNTEMILGLTRVLEDVADTSSIGAIVITGNGPGFAAGADIGEYASADPAAFARFTARANELCARLASVPVPVITAVDGPAIGGGFELVLSADLVFASPRSTFGLPETKLGLIPGWGGTQRLADYVGPHRAMELILTGATLSAQQAFELGIVNRVVSASRLLAEATGLATELCSGARLAGAATKRAVAAAFRGRPGLLVEQAELRSLFDTDDAREGIAAFVGKRPARFGGR